MAFLSVGLVILYLVYQNQNEAYMAECALKGIADEDCSLIGKILYDFATAKYFWLFMIFVSYMISNVSRAVRWNMLMNKLGFQPKFINSFLTIMLGYFANLGLPRLGEVVRPATLSRYEGIPLEQVMGTVVVDRIIDVISILIVSALAFMLQYDVLWGYLAENSVLQEKIATAAPFLTGLGLIGIIGLVLLYIFREKLKQTKVYEKISGILTGFLDGIKTVMHLDKPFLFFLHSINIWLMYYLMTYFCFLSFAPTADLSPVIALVVFVFGGWGIVIPSPGGMGTYHFLATTALGFYGVSGDDGFSWSNISFFTIQLGCNVVVGLLALLLLPIINKETRKQ